MKSAAQVGQDFKQQYPGAYDQYPDEVVGQRALLKNPSLGDSSMGDVAKDALSNALFEPGSTTEKIMSDPITQAQVLPSIAGAAGAVSGIPMGASLGTGGGNLLADAALKSYGRFDLIPSTKSQVIGTGVAALGDLTAIPAMNRKVLGSQIGSVETAAGVPAPQDIPSLPKPKAGDPVSGGIDSAIDSVNAATTGGGGTPTFWKQIKDQIDSFYNLGKDQKMTQLDSSKLQWLNGQVQKGLNTAVPGRAVPAANLAMSQTVPNMISSAGKAIPWWIKAPVAGALTWGGGDALVNAFKGGAGSNR